jgi:hypothetical protein
VLPPGILFRFLARDGFRHRSIILLCAHGNNRTLKNPAPGRFLSCQPTALSNTYLGGHPALQWRGTVWRS